MKTGVAYNADGSLYNKSTPIYVDKQQELYWAGVKPNEQPTAQTNQPTTEATWTPTSEDWIGQSRSEEQQMIDDIARTQEEVNNLKNREDALWQAEYLKKMKELQEYQAKQKEITDKQKAMSEEQAQIQSSRKLQDAQRSLSQLKRNTAYLSSQGLWQSAWALDAFSQQISNAEQVFKEMVQYEQYAEEMRKLGMEFDANAYERGMKEQQDELDKYVSDTIQTIFNNMSAAEMAWQMDTVDEVDAFATKYFNSIDTDIANMTRKQIQIAEQKQALQVAQLAEVKKFVANKWVINKDMSAAQGYYVDGNWSPIISATTGAFIPMPVDPPMEPVRDAKTGKLVSFSLWENGEIVADVQQVIDQPTFSANTIQNMVQAVANWTMTVGQAIDVLPPDAQQQFLDKIWSVKKQTETTIPQLQETRVVENADWTKTTYQRNPATNAFDIPVWSNYQTPSGVPIQDAIALAISKCATGAQCGKFVNDVLEATGQPRLVKDSYESKVQAIQTIGEAYSMEDVWAGSIFTYPVSWSSYWHIGIVTAVNADGTINIMDYNYNNDEKQRERTNVNANEILGKWGYLSKPIITEQNVAPMQWGTAQDTEIGIDDIISFNDDVTRRKMSKEEVKRIWEAKKAIMSNPNADINQIMQYSAWGKAIWETASKSLIKFDQALAQLDAVQSQIKDMSTWPIIWKIRNMNPWDTNAQVLKATIQGLIPTIARGVYGEVWVLTDNDVRLYAQTLPNLKGTDAINKWVLAVTLDVLAWGYKKQITGLAWQWYDVSWLEGTYENLKWQAEALKREIWVWTTQQPTTLPPEKKQASDDLRNSL